MEDVLTAPPVVPGDEVRGHGGVGVADVRDVVRVVDRRREVVNVVSHGQVMVAGPAASSDRSGNQDGGRLDLGGRNVEARSLAELLQTRQVALAPVGHDRHRPHQLETGPGCGRARPHARARAGAPSQSRSNPSSCPALALITTTPLTNCSGSNRVVTGIAAPNAPGTPNTRIAERDRNAIKTGDQCSPAVVVVT